MTPRRNLTCTAGFTLVELLIVIAILGIISAFAVPNYINTVLPQYRLREAARTVTTDLRLARMNAAATNVQYRLAFNPGAETYQLQRGNASSGSTTWTAEGSPRSFADPNNPYYQNNIDIYSVSVPNVTCSPTGTMTMTTIILKNEKGEQKQITSSIAGRIKTQ